jgi:hypothetical protein
VSGPTPLSDRRYAALYLGLLALFLIVFGAGLPALGGLFLWRAGEFLPLPEIVARQQTGGDIYGSALHDDEFDYKLALATARRAEVMALGSSRMLQLRQEFFRRPFVNAGRAMSSLREGEEFFAALPAASRPRLMILGMDPWWFNPQRPAYAPRRPRAGLGIGFLHLVADWLWQAKLSPDDIWQVALQGRRSNGLTQNPGLGVAAIIRASGYRADGSRDYGRRYTAQDPTFNDQGFANTLARLASADGPFEHGNHAAAARFAQFDALLANLQREGVTPVVILTPLAGRVLAAIRGMGEAFGYVAEVRAYLAGLEVESYDFLDPAALGADDCEFVDGFHGGEVVYQRILLAIVERNPASALAPLLDATALRAAAASSGYALAPESSRDYAATEADFLELGCPKPVR